jgi:glycosyltransferase involved in cell wall biosynthesis
LLSVLLDATAVPTDRRGVGRYIDSVIPALAARGDVALDVVCRPEDGEHYGTLSGRDPVLAPARTGHRAARLVWEQTGLAGTVARRSPDVLHCPHYTHPLAGRLLGNVPVVVTLHDATFFSDPELHTRIKGPFFRTASRLALRQAAVCLVPSQATADELIAQAGARPDHLQVAHHGVDSDVFHPPDLADIELVRKSLGLADGELYIAFLGTIEPRKNIPALIEGWAAAFGSRPYPPALVIAGGAGWNTDLDAVAARLPHDLRLIRPGYLPIEQLSAFLGGASMVAYPSLGEGFGLPVVEAMACGAPTVTTRRLALTEVAGDAAVYTEPDSGSIAATLAQLLDDSERRQRAVTAGIARAATFTWEACAEAHVQAYRRAAGGRR